LHPQPKENSQSPQPLRPAIVDVPLVACPPVPQPIAPHSRSEAKRKTPHPVLGRPLHQGHPSIHNPKRHNPRTATALAAYTCGQKGQGTFLTTTRPTSPRWRNFSGLDGFQFSRAKESREPATDYSEGCTWLLRYRVGPAKNSGPSTTAGRSPSHAPSFSSLPQVTYPRPPGSSPNQKNHPPPNPFHSLLLPVLQAVSLPESTPNHSLQK